MSEFDDIMNEARTKFLEVVKDESREWLYVPRAPYGWEASTGNWCISIIHDSDGETNYKVKLGGYILSTGYFEKSPLFDPSVFHTLHKRLQGDADKAHTDHFRKLLANS